MVRGTLLTLESRCGKSSCRCAHTKHRHPRHYLSWSEGVLCRQPLWSCTGVRGTGTSPHSGGDSPAIAPDATSQGRTFASFHLPVRSRAGCLRLPLGQGSAPGGLRSLHYRPLVSDCKECPIRNQCTSPKSIRTGHPISPPGSDRAGRGPLADTRRSANFPAEKEHRRM